MKYRDYQDSAIAAPFRWWAGGNKGNPLIVMPTGTGKSVVIAGIIAKMLTEWPGVRVMKLTHVKELIEQNYEKLLAVWPTAPAGVYSAGLNRRDANYPITYAGIATVSGHAQLFGRIDVILIDEAHLVSEKDSSMYRDFIDDLKKASPNLVVIGLTATHYRLKQGLLTEGDNPLFNGVCIDMSTREAFNWFIDQGYLCNLVPKSTETQFDLSEVHTQGGEFKANELQAAVNRDDITAAAIDEMLLHGADRNHWLIFATGVEHAEAVTQILEAKGVTATCVHSKMKDAERDQRIADYKAGKYRAMVNNGVLTTGFDFPAIDLLGILRPTKSPGLWVQILGRGTRPFYAAGFDLSTREGRLAAIAASPKKNCLVMDFAANTPRLGPINDPVLPKAKGKKGGGNAPIRTCDVCGCYNHASAKACISCGHVFPVYCQLETKAGTGELVATGERAPKPVIVLNDYYVDRVTYTLHVKLDRPTTLRVNYHCGRRSFSEFICFEHPIDGWPYRQAKRWWLARTRQPMPEFSSEALSLVQTLPVPSAIKVKETEKYPEIVAHVFKQETKVSDH